jgi:hypothetical protein
VARLGLVGNLSHDRVDGGPPRLGGGVFYGARGLELLGRDVQAVVGSDETRFAFRYEEDRREMAVEAVGPPWPPENVETLGADVRWVHAAPLLRSDFAPETLAALAGARTLSLDGQGLVRIPAVGPLRLAGDFDSRLLEHVSILKLSEEEAEVVGSVDVPEVVITRGSRGCTVIVDGSENDVPCRRLEDVDPTGAGDVFAVGYLAARSDGLEPVAAAEAATALVARFLA